MGRKIGGHGTEVKKIHVKSFEFVKIENEKNKLKSELDRLRLISTALKA